ncbi:putative F-box domain-containing protein [Helianthus debilis subsp. tardiflorus]
MSEHIPFEIQLEIMNMLPVKSLLRFRSVCKAWKSLIDSSDFIKHYFGQQQYLLLRFKDLVNNEQEPMSIVDDDSFPTQTASVTLPSLVKYPSIIGSSHGLLCFYGCDNSYPGTSIGSAVIFNPCIRKTVAFVVPRVTHDHLYRTVIGFGVCIETKDPKIVKIRFTRGGKDIKSVDWIPWQVEVFTLSTKTWRSPYSSSNVPSKSIYIYMDQVVVDGCLYWLARDRLLVDDEYYNNLIVSFDLTSEEFREVNLPDSLARVYCSLSMDKIRDSLAVIKIGFEDHKLVYDVWMMEKDDATKSFIKLYTISSHSPDVWLRGFRKTGEPLIEVILGGDHGSTRMLATYDPYSETISNVRSNERSFSCFVYSYRETLLLI